MDIEKTKKDYLDDVYQEVKPLVKETLDLLEMLPDEYVAEVKEFTKTLVKKWDPDYTKLTSSEKASLEEAEEEIKTEKCSPRTKFGRKSICCLK